jgi:hypothetical protein
MGSEMRRLLLSDLTQISIYSYILVITPISRTKFQGNPFSDSRIAIYGRKDRLGDRHGETRSHIFAISRWEHAKKLKLLTVFFLPL